MQRFRRMSALVVGSVALMTVAAACGSSSTGTAGGTGFQGTALTAGGATFPDPIYEQWLKDFQQKESGAKINYQAIGSGGGVDGFTNGTFDFAGSDAPLQTDEIAALPGESIEIPTVLGGVAVSYNVAGIDSGLKLDGQTIADIFMGTVTAWNDPAIASQNPGVTLPSTPISVVHRNDESGTTFVFTNWLSSQSPEWASKVGADKAVAWPTGTGGDGNDGVAAGVSQTDGSIGYLSFDFAVSSGLGVAQIKRADGTYVAPSVDSISKAGGDLTFPIQPTSNILNANAPGAYPIASTTYLLIPKDMSDANKAQTIFDFVTWALTTGQAEATQLNYSPLPSDVAAQGLKELSAMTAGGKALTASPGIGG